ncbi:Eco57I restriction-modification methylase domain-containing protein [Candidatus Micrarchaeota archaeon]|nr:Eco57I restriction-modification methylase domain-containing protein [Candidatus Micrarchaeota archaeon]
MDSKAVEIAQLNLLLKTTDKKHKLPKLQENIKNGNSLIDDSTITEKAFNWNKEFETIMENGGFDIVIGNPPYVKVEQIKKDEKDYFFKNFSHIGGRLDLYILFLEKASSILKEKGLMSFILPSIWLKAKYGKELRRHILENYSICAFIDFGDLKVFENVTTYPCILILQKTKPAENSGFVYIKVPELSEQITQNLNVFVRDNARIIFQKKVNDTWEFGSSKTTELFEKIKKSSNITLSSIRDQIYEGFITGNNKIYFIGAETIDKCHLEKALVVKVPKAKNIRRFSIGWKNEYVIYPYQEIKQRTIPIDIEKYPKVKQYLTQFEKVLKNRKSLEGTNKKWFEYVRPREKNWFERPKILTPNLAATNNFAVDAGQNKEYFYVDHDAYAITIKSDDLNELIFICGILNSKVAEFYIKRVSPMFSGGYYKYHTQYLDSIPIIFGCKEEIVNLVKKIAESAQKLTESKTNQNLALLDTIKNYEKELNEVVYALYGVTEEEKKIIEDSLKK